MLTVDARDERDQLAGVIVAALVDARRRSGGDRRHAAGYGLDAAFAQLEQRSTKRVLVLDDLQS